ncbi:hypothetical protein XBLMG947_0595 [Xanthomonas bromi]|uniref:Uncharacterized protein n=1 Tax=Xanthomonas bromi TaxID=56449 RepID=A0A1C3NHF5_9XANT|nr:hypothetical protein [Xanthomonas bromi]PPV08960.1 hypothetical protein XbrCFBP1976_00740 [Xanthomonas bromi]SBV49821.1 hypothetical protein XBLMG947_0595 [Xanthomonas bromi]
MSDSPKSRYAAFARRVVEAHAAQLLRDLQIINERTVRELGPLPHGGLPVQPKRKPKPAPWVQPVQELAARDADAPLAPQLPHTETGGSEMVKLGDSVNEQPLPPVPVPQKLREILNEYPEYIQRLQCALDRYARNPDSLMPFDAAIWILEAHLDSFLSEAREELERAQASGDANAVKMAEEKERSTRHARSRNRGMSDLDQLWNYIETHKESLT